MSSIIPKEQQSAYERWEMASFGDERPGAQTAAVTKLATEQVARMREAALREGFSAGQTEGYAVGLQAGRAEAEREIAVLRQIAASFSTELTHANDTIANDVLNLALDVAKAMLRTSLAVRPELVLPIIGEAIRYLPSVQQPALLHLNPQDVALIKDHMGDELAKSGWRLAEDMHLARGGCRIETASNQIDASLPTRWQRIVEALGREPDWLEP